MPLSNRWEPEMFELLVKGWCKGMADHERDLRHLAKVEAVLPLDQSAALRLRVGAAIQEARDATD